MNTLMKAGLALAVVGSGAFAVHHVARAADPVPAAAKADSRIKIPATLEAHIRAMARAHAPSGQADAAEAHVMAALHAHLAEVAKDAALLAEVNRVMAAAEAGDEAAMEHIHQVLVSLLHAEHP